MKENTHNGSSHKVKNLCHVSLFTSAHMKYHYLFVNQNHTVITKQHENLEINVKQEKFIF